MRHVGPRQLIDGDLAFLHVQKVELEVEPIIMEVSLVFIDRTDRTELLECFLPVDLPDAPEQADST